MNPFAPQPPVPETSPAATHQRQGAGEPFLLLDVREHEEVREARVAGSTHIPLGELAYRVGELPTDQTIVVMCRSGKRSEMATRFLQQSGFADVQNLTGGILAWAQAGLPVEQG